MWYDCDRGRQTQVGRQIGGDSRSGWNFLIKIGYAGGHSKVCRSGSSCLFAAIQTSRIKAPPVGQIGRSTVRSGKEIVLKGATGDLVR
jgi:hypothetical protein